MNQGIPPQWSPDWQWWWDGVRWVPASQAPMAPPTHVSAAPTGPSWAVKAAKIAGIVVGYLMAALFIIGGIGGTRLYPGAIIFGVLLAAADLVAQNAWGLRRRVPVLRSSNMALAAGAWVGIAVIMLATLAIGVPPTTPTASTGTTAQASNGPTRHESSSPAQSPSPSPTRSPSSKPSPSPLQSPSAKSPAELAHEGQCAPQPCANDNYGWVVVPNRFQYDAASGNPYETPEAGNVYVTVDVTFTNYLGSSRSANPFDFKLQDGTGVTHDLTYTDNCPLWQSVDVGPGATYGPKCLAFEAVARHPTNIYLIWTPSILSGSYRMKLS